MGKHSQAKRQNKVKKQHVLKLQQEIGAEIIKVLEDSVSPLDASQILNHYPDNARRKENDDKTLKLYISMGLGYLIEAKKVKELPKTEDGRFPLALV
ncbi:MAG: hypothetical protein DRG24_07705 [Epsilonproteobacteria bacterium]|nr:MAG: hypothetical protein DRG24_07705 [Campylobacterota bacterium]